MIKNDIEKFLNIQKLKFTYRWSWRTFNWEQESTAEHSWCCLLVADYLLEKLNNICPWKYNLDKLKIYEYIMYHDLIEAETWDVDIDPSSSEKIKTKKEVEEEAFPIFLDKIPNELKEIYKKTISEYEKRETLESKFVKLVDVIESEFQCFFHKDMFIWWEESYFIEAREKHFKHFPELKFIYNEILDYYKKNNYFKN